MRSGSCAGAVYTFRRILKHYNDHLPTGCEPRPSRSLETKWGVIKHNVANFFWKKNLFVRVIPTSSWGWQCRDLEGALSEASSRTCHCRFFDCGSYQFCARCKNRSYRKEEKIKSFCVCDSHLMVRLATSGFGGGRSPRPLLELVVAGFLIAAATDSNTLAVSVRISSLYAH
jgi:hypothetical protein